ncbi:MAG: Gfo/Idh/MocA family oxidoreductase [bacterium]|nr:Gfo/Idh/MocA family oxidoreductase [bacterium]
MMGIEHIANIAVLDGTEVTAISDPDETQRAIGVDASRGVPGFSTHQQLLRSGLCDAVVVVAPNYHHHEILLDAIEAGVHVLTEKPMCTTARQCADVRDAAAKSDRVHWVGLEYRYMPPVAALLERLEAAGDVKMVSIREHRFPFLPKVGNWNRFRENTGGTLVEKCCHFFDLMNLVVGARAVRVMASGGQDVNHLGETYDGRRSDILDNALVVVEYDNGVRAHLDLCMFAEGSPFEQEISVTGSMGKVEAFVPPGETGRPGIVQVNTRADGLIERSDVEDSHIPHVGMHHGASYLEHVDFRDAILHGSAPKVTYEDGLWSVIIGEAAHKSIDEARVVEIAELLPS